MSKDKAGGIPCADGIDEEVHTEPSGISPRWGIAKQLDAGDFITNALLFYSKAGRIMFKVQDSYPV